MGFLKAIFGRNKDRRVESKDAFRIAPIVKDRASIGSEPFRFPDDPEHVVRFPYDHSLERRLYDSEPVSGVSYHQESVIEFLKGSNRSLDLEAEPDNQYDKNAIAVYGIWTQKDGTKRREQLGYVRKGAARELSKQDLSTLGVSLHKCFYPSAEHPTPGLRINIYRATRVDSSAAAKPE